MLQLPPLYATVLAVDEARSLFAIQTAIGEFGVLRWLSVCGPVLGDRFILPSDQLSIHVLHSVNGFVVALNVTPLMKMAEVGK